MNAAVMPTRSKERDVEGENATSETKRSLSIALGVCAVLVGLAFWLHATGPGVGAAYDFHAYLRGAQDIAAGRNPYAAVSAQAIDSRAGDTGFHAFGYVYPPLLATLLAGLLKLGLGDRAIWIVWNLVNVGAMAWLGSALQRTLRGRREWSGALAFGAAVLLCGLATYDLFLGQADLLMAALVIGACELWLRRNPWSGVVLGLAIAVKPTMALVLLVWLWKGDWRAAARGAVAAIALVALPFILLGPRSALDYLTFMTHWNAFQANAEYINQSPYGMLLRVFTVNPYTTPAAVLPWLVTPLRLIVMVGAVVWWMRIVPRARTADLALAMGECLLALPLILLLGPLSEDIHYCVLLPALVGLSWLAWARGLARHPAAWLLWATLAVFWVPRMQELIYPDRFIPLPLQSDPHLGTAIALLRTGTLLYGALVVLVAGGVVLRRAFEALPSVRHHYLGSGMPQAANCEAIIEYSSATTPAMTST
jgi:hypothetical protein